MEVRPVPVLRIVLWIVIIVIVAIIGYVVINALLTLTQSPAQMGETLRDMVNPTPTIIADPVSVVLEIRDLARLETAAYTIEKVITAETGQGALAFLLGDRLLLVAHGQVVAGVDLSKMSEEDVVVSGDEVLIILPAAEVFDAYLDNDQTYVYDRDTGLLGPERDLETQARQEAEAQILNAALEDGILERAQGNAEDVVAGLVRALGYERVTFITATPMPALPTPASP